MHPYTSRSRLIELNAEKMASAPFPEVEPSPANIVEEVDSLAKVPLEKGDSLKGGSPNNVDVLEDVQDNSPFGRVENEGKFRLIRCWLFRFSDVILFVFAAASSGFLLVPEYYFFLLHW